MRKEGRNTRKKEKKSSDFHPLRRRSRYLSSSPENKTLKMHQNLSIARVNSTQACAACKYQRRKCQPDCILAPYFPHDRQRQFLNAHKLFGVSNITKIIRHLDQPEKDAAMRTIIFQSDVRANDPIGGCYRLVRNLQRQIDYTKAELDIVLRQLALCRAQAQAARVHQQHIMQLVPDDATDSTLNCDIFYVDPLGSNEQQHINVYHHLQPHQEHLIQSDNNVSLQELSDSWGMQGSVSSHLPIPKQPSPSECNDFKPLDYSSNDSHDLIFDYEEKIEPSDDANLKENKATVEDEVSFQCDRDHDFTNRCNYVYPPQN